MEAFPIFSCVLPTDILYNITEIITGPCFPYRQTYLSWHSTNKIMFNKRGDASKFLDIWNRKMEEIKTSLQNTLCGKSSLIYNGYLKDIAVLTIILKIEKYLNEYINKQTSLYKPIEDRLEILPAISVSQDELCRVNFYISARYNWYLQFFTVSSHPVWVSSPKICLVRSK